MATLPPIYINSRCRVILDAPTRYAKIKLQYRVKWFDFTLWKTVNTQYQKFIIDYEYFPTVEQMVKAIYAEGQGSKLVKLRKRSTIRQALLLANRGNKK